ncbi:MAG TPA: SDR family oxidoreductase [Alphaproteobacteria bacterium]|nr:SDR family oxidoreductase [Alphaproteobacteria bacterium]
MSATPPQTALVTGAARRIGRAIALNLAAHGFGVGVHYHRSRKEAEEVVGAIKAKGGRAVALRADLGRERDTTTLVAALADALGPPCLLVNNASLFERDDALTATRASWDAHMEANLRAPFVLSQEFARRLPADADGLIVNMLDQRVWNVTPHFTSYTVSKAGLWTITQTLALALAPRVRVNAIGPGPVLPSSRQTQVQFDRQVASVPLRRSAKLEEICAAIHFMIAAKSMTGQMIALDGGQHLNWASPQLHPMPEE